MCMKDFFKSKTWDDYLTYSVLGLIIGGLAVFFIGFYWGFEMEAVIGSGVIDEFSGKYNVRKIISLSKDNPSALALICPELIGEQNLNLFTLAGSISSESNPLFAFVVISLFGFSMIILGIVVMIVSIATVFIIDLVIRNKIKKEAKVKTTAIKKER